MEKLMTLRSKVSKSAGPRELFGCRGKSEKAKVEFRKVRNNIGLVRTISGCKVWRVHGILQGALIISRKSDRTFVDDGAYSFRENGKRRASIGLFDHTKHFLLILIRVAVVGSIVSALAVAYLITRFVHPQLFPLILRKGIEVLGPIFVKLGQWASTRKDMIPEEICDTLSRLQRKVPPHSWSYTNRLFESIYGAQWRNLFVKFESESPIGSGCCGQVYKAWIKVDPSMEIESTSEDARETKFQAVAVKVLHPGIKEQLDRDLSIIRGMCKLATYVIPRLHWLSLTDCIDEFSQIMEKQLDMKLEAANLVRFSKNFSNKKEVIFPRPYPNLTHKDVLVETFHEGSHISNYFGGTDPTLQGKLAKIGITTILKMVFRDNFIHCDLHPGNILVEVAHHRSDSSLFPLLWKVITRNYTEYTTRLVVLDCGLVVSLNDRCRQNLRDVFRSVLMGNGELAAEYILEHSSHMTPDPEGFRAAIKDIVDTHLREKMSLSKVNVSTVVSELFSAMVRHRVKQDGSFSSVILSMLVIEGLGRTLDPNIDIFTEVLPFVLTNDRSSP